MVQGEAGFGEGSWEGGRFGLKWTWWATRVACFSKCAVATWTDQMLAAALGPAGLLFGLGPCASPYFVGWVPQVSET